MEDKPKISLDQRPKKFKNFFSIIFLINCSVAGLLFNNLYILLIGQLAELNLFLYFIVVFIFVAMIQIGFFSYPDKKNLNGKFK